MLCAIRRVSLRVARGALVGVGCEGDLVCHRLGGGDWGSAIPSFVGIWPPAFPGKRGFGLILFGIPHSAAAGALAQ